MVADWLRGASIDPFFPFLLSFLFSAFSYLLSMIPLFLFNCCLLILILSGGLELEGERHYHYDEMVVMRDGISLHTVVFLPNDPTNKRYPAVVDRSPYG